MQSIVMASSLAPAVLRARERPSVAIAFEGTRAEHVSDRGLHITITIPVARAVELRHLLGQVLPESLNSDWRAEILELLETHRGETGADEDALEVARRLSRFWREGHS